MAEYKVVEVTQLDATELSEYEDEGFSSILREFCPCGWEIISARMMAENGIQRALVLLSR